MESRGKKAKHKGVACRRGQPVFYDEIKKPRNLSLTDTAIKNLKSIADKTGTTSLSETLEQILRGSLNPQDYFDWKNEEKSTD